MCSSFVHAAAQSVGYGKARFVPLSWLEVSNVQPVKTQYPMTSSSEAGHPVRMFAMACQTFASNVMERLHEYADAHLAEELTIAEQRKRLLGTGREGALDERPRALAHSVAHVK